ncbi:replication termination factor 2-like [Dreissena polymorpha]|uniref:replication termination factor 2-like n=1 Tax=Dreissena polymorpha TaxID=45954 RepID=UPI002263C2A3|nr:replication termination factor 2-like [Dreissena polymorpha]
MGCDGGTIPKRDELIRTKQKPEQKDKAADLAARWKHCAISQEPLREPVMACELGRLYNKESALEFLIDRTKFECASSFEHLRGLKDLKELNLTENPSYSRPQSMKGDGYVDIQDTKYICPVVGIEMNGKHKFACLWSCGCVLSDRAMKEVKGDKCHKCGKPYQPEDVITLNCANEEVEELQSHMTQRRLQQKLDKKSKKAKKQKLETVPSESSLESGPSTSKQPKMEKPVTKDSKLTNGNKVSKVVANGSQKPSNGIIGATVRNPLGTSLDLPTSGSVQKDPKTSATYKSLFTSSDKAKNQMKGHWVTCNPYWN